MKVGDKYKRVVRLFLIQEGKLTPYTEKEDEAEIMYEVERKTRINQMISAALTALVNASNKHHLHMPPGYFDHVMYGKNVGEPKMWRSDDGRFSNGLSDEEYCDIIFTVVKSIHDNIVRNSRQAILNNSYRGDISRFMPLEFAGMDEFYACYALFEEIFLELGLAEKRYLLEKYYQRMTKDSVKKWKMKTGSDFVACIKMGSDFYPAWTDSIASIIKGDGALAEKLALSSMHHVNLGIK